MPHPIGFIHGRFQVVHNDHLKYLLAGKALCDHLIVGITNPNQEMTCDEKTDPARSSKNNNPLTYDEREHMIRAALLESGITTEEFSIVPFPISRPDLLAGCAPADATYYLTIYDAWGREKKQRLESLGLKTHVMWEKSPEEKGLTGKAVRTAIREGRDWKSMIPKSVAEYAEQWDLQNRFNELSSAS